MLTKEQCYGIDAPLVYRAAKAGGVVDFSHDVEETMQDLIADAIAQYNPEKGMLLQSWVYKYISWHIGRRLSVINKQNREYSLDAVVSDDNNTTFKETISSDFDLEGEILDKEEATDRLAKLKDAISKIDEKGRFIVDFLFNHAEQKRTYVQLGQALADAQYVKYDMGRKKRKDSQNNQDAPNQEVQTKKIQQHMRSRAQQLAVKYINRLKALVKEMEQEPSITPEMPSRSLSVITIDEAKKVRAEKSQAGETLYCSRGRVFAKGKKTSNGFLVLAGSTVATTASKSLEKYLPFCIKMKQLLMQIY